MIYCLIPVKLRKVVYRDQFLQCSCLLWFETVYQKLLTTLSFYILIQTPIWTDLNKIITWAAENRIDFNLDKFEQIRLQKSNKRKLSSYFFYWWRTNSFGRDTVKDLKVCCNFETSWIYHITESPEKANMNLNYVRRSSPNSLSSSVRISVFKNFILSKKLLHLQVGFRPKTNVSEWKNFNDDA